MHIALYQVINLIIIVAVVVVCEIKKLLGREMISTLIVQSSAYCHAWFTLS